MPTPPPIADSDEGPDLTLRRAQSQWYGTRIELNWRDRVLGETLGYPDADSYAHGFKEHDPSWGRAADCGWRRYRDGLARVRVTGGVPDL
jgi:hypothetical protein